MGNKWLYLQSPPSSLLHRGYCCCCCLLSRTYPMQESPTNWNTKFVTCSYQSVIITPLLLLLLMLFVHCHFLNSHSESRETQTASRYFIWHLAEEMRHPRMNWTWSVLDNYSKRISLAFLLSTCSSVRSLLLPFQRIHSLPPSNLTDHLAGHEIEYFIELTASWSTRRMCRELRGCWTRTRSAPTFSSSSSSNGIYIEMNLWHCHVGINLLQYQEETLK